MFKQISQSLEMFSGKRKSKKSRKKARSQAGRRMGQYRFETLEPRMMLTLPTGIQSTELFQLGYLDVTAYVGVDITGGGDSTAGIQKAIIDAFDNRLSAYFPNGTYTITDTLRVDTYAFWDASKNGPGLTVPKAHNLAGEVVDGVRPVIQLAPNMPLFGDVGNLRPMIVFSHFEAINSGGTQSALPNAPLGTPANFKLKNNSLFRVNMRDIDFDTGGNAGAFGVMMTAAQETSVENVRVDATGSYAGFWGLPGRNSASTNLEVQGGQYGIRVSGRQGGDGSAGVTLVGAKLYDQTVSALYTDDFVPMVVVGFDIVKASGPVVTTQTVSWSTAVGTIDLIDGKIAIGDGSLAIDNSSARNIYMRNVYVTGTNDLVQSGNRPTVTATGTWKQIEEYTYNDQENPASDPPYEVGDTRFRSFSLIDGVVSQTPEPTTSVQSSTAAPPADIVAQHVWNSLVSIKDGDTDGDGIGEFMNVMDFGATPSFAYYTGRLNDGDDDRPAIQAAIDAASAAGHGRVFLPRGIFQIGGTLTLRANTKFFGAGRRVSQIHVHDNWKPTSGEPAMIQTVDDAEATTFLGFMTLKKRTQGGGTLPNGANAYDRFNEVNWRAGRLSMTTVLEFGPEWIPGGQAINPQSVYKFTGNGGGRHWSVRPYSDSHSGNADSRLIKVEGTTEPLAFYGLNIEATKNAGSSGPIADFNIEINNASNVRLYGNKREGESGTILIKDSQNIAFYGGGAMRFNLRAGDYYKVVGNSDDILLTTINVQKMADALRTPRIATLSENITGQSPVEIEYPDSISIYKRGEIDDTVMNFGPGVTQNADFDGDNDVDGADFLAWQRGFGTPAPVATREDGDADGDYDVDGDDLAVWQGQYGKMNGAPTANTDNATSDQNMVVVISVLGNDTDPENDTLSVSFITQAANGTVVNNGTNVTYTPDNGFSGTDSFTYRASDGQIDSNLATVNVTVEDPAAPSVVTLAPVADAYVYAGNNAEKNYGTNSVLIVRSAGNWTREAFLKFDLTGESGTVASAKLFLEAVADDNNSTLVLHDVSFVANDSWSEGGLTWSNKPAYGASLEQLGIPGLGTYQFDVTSAIQSELGGLFSLAVTAENNVGTFISYASRENSTAAFRPKLEITYAGGALTLESGAGESGLAAPFTGEATSIDTVSSELIDAAAARRQAAGVDTSALANIDVQVRDLSEGLLGFAPLDTNTLWIDRNAAGRGWFVDPTPWDDFEFDKRGLSINGDADDVDLLSVLTHEMGHLLGLGHDDASDGANNDFMGETLSAGERRMPSRALAYDFALALIGENEEGEEQKL